MRQVSDIMLLLHAKLMNSVCDDKKYLCDAAEYRLGVEINSKTARFMVRINRVLRRIGEINVQ